MDVKTRMLEQHTEKLRRLLAALEKKKSLKAKIAFLRTLPIVQEYLSEHQAIKDIIEELNSKYTFAVLSIIVIGQAPIVFNFPQGKKVSLDKLKEVLEQLLELDHFFNKNGGIIGYHLTVLNLIIKQSSPSSFTFDHTRYIHPEGIHLMQDHGEAKKAVRWGIENVQNLGEMYPLGGAGDRLNLIEESTGAALPAARLKFLGHSLLEGLIRDLQAREYLTFKLFGKHVATPVAMMTSLEKNNHQHILEICKERHWFGRSPDSFFLFIQPLVPMITFEGNWALKAPLQLILKPSGHGVMWKLAEEQGVFNWFESLGRHQCLVRQINNPLAGLDDSLLALMGIGCHEHKAFGFLSCERLLNSAEGTNVLIESEHDNVYEYRLTNIEYTDFIQKGIEETPAHPRSPYSNYPANTNILFADLSALREGLKICPIPGQLINMKTTVSYIDPKGKQSFVPGGRLESTMQNIADSIVDYFPKPLNQKECKNTLKTFIVYNVRSKTISTTKHSYKQGESSLSTPEQAFYDLLSNHQALFQECKFEVPQQNDFEDFLLNGPSCLILYHPALGPLYSVIKQKIRQGTLKAGSEIQLEIAEVDIEGLYLEGSLLVEAISPLGWHDDKGLLHYGKESRCILKQVTIRNQGIDRQATQNYWQNEINRKEALHIILGEGAEFHAEGLTFEGNYRFEVPPNHRFVIRCTSSGKLIEELTPIKKPTWHWQYAFDSKDDVRLEKTK